MGYDLARFSGTVDEELICTICSGVFEDPVQVIGCEHYFCRACIEQWLARSRCCPVDRAVCDRSNLGPVPRIIRTLLSRLSIVCENAIYGCTQVCQLDELRSHLRACQYQPNISRSYESDLRPALRALQNIVTDLRNETQTMRREMTVMREAVRNMCADIVQTEQAHDLVRWSSSLPRPRAIHWDALISTPDQVLKTVVSSALAASGCPIHSLQMLIENCHERKWPAGLNTLEMRQTNRGLIENFIYRRVPGEQAVIAFSCLNPHLSQETMVEPGLVFIFAEGVE